MNQLLELRIILWGAMTISPTSETAAETRTPPDDGKDRARGPKLRREIMKLLIRAAFLAASIGSIGTAHADQVANTQPPAQSDRAFAAVQGGSGAARLVTQQYATSVRLWDQNQGAEG
jgi:hypothetical protein